MIASKPYKIISLFLAFLILFSSSGLTLDIHFCQGKMKRLNLFGEAKSCAEVSQMIAKCHKSKAIHLTCGIDGEHQGCCDNDSFDLDLDFDAGEMFSKSLTDREVQFYIAFTPRYLVSVRPSPTLHNWTNYFPPPLERDLRVLFQTFLM